MILAVAVALALQTTLARFAIRGTVAVDLGLVAVVYIALTSGPVTGLLAGTLTGLLQDALATSIIGIGGLAKTVVGFLAGVVGTQFIVTQPLPRFVVFFAATVLNVGIFLGLYLVIDPRRYGATYAGVTGQALGNAIVGVVLFQLVELLPGAMERRRARDRSRIRR
ncbi:MAG TPA: rod shape-determining protein MreD [Vicinamibacterales bacterium]